MRIAWLALTFALSAASAASAGEFVVVSSTDPAFRAGHELEAGATVPLAPGQTLVVIHASGAVTRLMGSPKGAMVPMVRMATADAQRVEVLRMLVAQPRARRSGVIPSQACPAPETLTEMEGIIAAARRSGCVPAARQAFGAYVERALGESPPPPEV